MIVMIVIGIVAAATTGRFHAVMVQQRVQRAAAATQGDIEAAFAIAARNRVPIRVSWDASNVQVDVTDRAGATIYRKSNLGVEYGLTAAGVSFSRSPFEVYPDGLANDSLTIALTVERTTDTVRVSRTGLVRR